MTLYVSANDIIRKRKLIFSVNDPFAHKCSREYGPRIQLMHDCKSTDKHYYGMRLTERVRCFHTGLVQARTLLAMEVPTTLESRRGKKCIIVTGNFKLLQFRQVSDGSVHYRCTNKNCSTAVYINPLTNVVIRTAGVHGHEGWNIC